MRLFEVYLASKEFTIWYSDAVVNLWLPIEVDKETFDWLWSNDYILDKNEMEIWAKENNMWKSWIRCDKNYTLEDIKKLQGKAIFTATQVRAMRE